MDTCHTPPAVHIVLIHTSPSTHTHLTIYTHTPHHLHMYTSPSTHVHLTMYTHTKPIISSLIYTSTCTHTSVLTYRIIIGLCAYTHPLTWLSLNRDWSTTQDKTYMYTHTLGTSFTPYCQTLLLIHTITTSTHTHTHTLLTVIRTHTVTFT